ncbi:GMC oxidoreductase [Auriscalpium vulgare]|uniref:GMC oxidoreductase n=1 Tax=Auriscalpium vulgare TaxID=40419 RepID=A0ACB8SCI2_9AGAM|nr:GMC oxidoreductase [Auriscalpium vulgare]
MLVVFIALFASALRPVMATLYSDPSQIPAGTSYSYIIVGAGPGGSVMANRLSEDSSNRILLIESGPSDSVNPYIQVPFLANSLFPTSVSWNYSTVPQASLGGRQVPYPRGHTLGGSTSIRRRRHQDSMVWTRGPSDDYDAWATAIGDSALSWNNMQGIFQGVENLVPPADGHDTAGQVTPSIHGTNGPVKISVQGYPQDFDSKIYSAVSQLSEEFPFNQDMSSGNPLGIGYSLYAIGDGKRSSAAAAYLTPILDQRQNLDILVNTRVTKVIQTGTSGGLPVFNGVQFAQSATGSRYALNATKDVILSAGAVNTPQILQLSGIGDPDELSKLQITALVNLPDVGKNLQDHVVLPNVFTVNTSYSNDDLRWNDTLFAANLAQWDAEKNGPFATGPSASVGWLRLPSNSSILAAVTTDPSSGPHSPHIEFVFGDAFASFVAAPPDTGRHMTLASNLITPTSRGTVTLASTDPFDAPLIDPAFLSTDFDIHTIREGIKAAKRFADAPAWDGYIIGPYGDFADAETDADLEAYARRNAATVFHPSCTAFMSPADSGVGVLNPDFTVKKTKGLRVVDASVFPFIPTAHPTAPIYFFAERAAEWITG